MKEDREFTLPGGCDRTRALELALRILQALPLERAWRIRCTILRNERSLDQNAYLWGVPYKLLGEHTGFEADELHEYFCGQFFGWRDKRIPKTPRNKEGYVSVPVRTTTRDERGKRDVLPWDKFSDFVAYIQRFAAEKCSIIIPDPDPQYRERVEHKAKAA